ncbi:MAG: sulfatase-like hydrolase/transferase, partial [Bacteroidota bacterium]
MNKIKLSALGFGLLFFVLNFYSCKNPDDKTQNSNKPNIVLIFIDDMGYADVGCFGATDYKTPNIDQLANEGARFTDFYVSQAVCSASRGALLTGCYSERIGIKGALMPNSNIGINPDEIIIPEMLKEQGYATGIFGKWHLGHHKEFLPLQHGFDEYLGLPYSNDMWPVGFDGVPQAGTGKRKSNYPPLPLFSDNQVVDTIASLEDQAKLTTLYTEKAVQFIQKHKNEPFFLYMPHSMVHVPIAVSDKFKGKSGKGLFADVMMELDWSVGQILKTLKENGLDENTLVVFTSDNGPWLNFGNHAGSADPLREGKGAM